MHEEQYTILKEWYNSYVCSFRNRDTVLENAVTLKYEHTMRVCSEMDALCKSESLDEHRIVLALTSALLHDVARFEQFEKYHTFSDKQSINHAEMGIEIIERYRLLSSFSDSDADTIRAAIRHHNAVGVPDELAPEALLLCRLLRDADKLDIYKIALDHYIKPVPGVKETLQDGISGVPVVAPEICACIKEGRSVPYRKIRSMSDFKMIQAGWIFDLNFIYSFNCVHQRGYLTRLRKELPDSDLVQETLDLVERYLLSRISGAM